MESSNCQTSAKHKQAKYHWPGVNLSLTSALVSLLSGLRVDALARNLNVYIPDFALNSFPVTFATSAAPVATTLAACPL